MSCKVKQVASRAEAWIETPVSLDDLAQGSASPPARRRGLKQELHDPVRHGRGVASRAEAWIETSSYRTASIRATRSPPARRPRRRGLKLNVEPDGPGLERRLPRGGVD